MQAIIYEHTYIYIQTYTYKHTFTYMNTRTCFDRNGHGWSSGGQRERVGQNCLWFDPPSSRSVSLARPGPRMPGGEGVATCACASPNLLFSHLLLSHLLFSHLLSLTCWSLTCWSLTCILSGALRGLAYQWASGPRLPSRPLAPKELSWSV